jgi:ferredoxin-NADP reductase
MLQEEKCIWFVVKKASENGMSDFLTQSITIGDQVTLKWALGHYIDPKRHQNYLFISIGSGLSPNLGIFQHLVYESGNYHRIVNILGERTARELVPFIQDRFTQHGAEGITNFFCLSQELVTHSDYTQWYVQTKLADAVTLLGKQTTCFVCGSPAIVTDVVYQLTALGIAREDIIVEKY